ncbi:ex11b-like protein [Ophiostoma piceae UAMH 11346]|uniref:Ex11b-like protein n=1 Tax=Ophiostoma piceae (strain UAMH 11346) TaxID=1262450 RepID=S3CYM7_OPHP1|nr:ex11b-like protein [Ophiostoma piceae UAMH 11346]
MAFVEQFIRFTSDASGLERTFRMIQSLLLVITSSPFLLEVAASYMGGTSGYGDALTKLDKEHVLTTTVVLIGARDRVNMWRRFFRVFRFVESFHVASKLMGSLMGPNNGARSATKAKNEKNAKNAKKARFQLRPEWIELFARMFGGMYLFLESLTVIDAMGVTGLAVWGPERARALNVEGQRYWFLSLGCSVLAAVVRMLRVAKDMPPPVPTEEEKHENMGSPLAEAADEDGGDEQVKSAKLEAERLRLRRIVKGRMQVRRVWIRKLQARLVVLGRRAFADFIDMLAPGSIVGWTPADGKTVGVSMALTTLLTGYDVWLRCGRELAEAKAKAQAEAEAVEEDGKAAESKKTEEN